MGRRPDTAKLSSAKPKVRFGPKFKRRSKAISSTHSSSTRLNRNIQPEVCPSEDFESASSSSAEVENEVDDTSSTGDVVESEVKQDPFAFVGETTANDHPISQGELCELHSYDSRHDSKGHRIVLRTGSKYEFDGEEVKSPEAALVLTRNVVHGKVVSISLEIRSPYIKKALKEVIASYPGVNIDSEQSVRLHGKPRCLFHYRHELEEYARTSVGASMKQHVAFCLKYMEKALAKELSIYNNMMMGKTSMARINFDELWMAFKPGTLVYLKSQGSEYVYRLKDMDEDDDHHENSYWSLDLEKVESNGKSFGLVHEHRSIRRFEGYKALTDLEICPLLYHKEFERIREDLLARGRNYVALSGVHYRMYDGAQKPAAGARHRIIVDGHTYNSTYRPHKVHFGHDQAIETGDGKIPALSEEHLLMCFDEVPGFSLTTKKWGFFNVNQIQDIQFNATAFDNLALAPEKKDLVMALVNAGQGSAANYDDMIKGKGKGIIFLLHGPAGVGKTFTAESIAEHTQRPLYTLSCNDLGMSSIHVESQLSAALAQATKWNAIVLMDEADVFMAERSLNDLARNELVSVLLRVLEYFEGILFLTTNRAETIDPAFKSRIHFTLAYPNLSTEAKCDLWKVFIARGPTQQLPQWVDDDFLEQVAEHDMNGRQIKNAVRVAYALAHDKKRDLFPGDVLSVLRLGKLFGADEPGK
ncbi:P-loop containing nucleoside triphosphate hydrolase protein [Ophiobolus disseminans]|uniref:P-loop containing nucleoside triphosphate hydrolase protein n=1 Tax=Ophiobolus disseminans TaxID=1469910 RepID=A0A6A7AMM7_9PLEO|nr:P-loop containing nucleoside triphosphate hydrolase protein [Ophiobolus disseminans]